MKYIVVMVVLLLTLAACGGGSIETTTTADANSDGNANAGANVNVNAGANVNAGTSAVDKLKAAFSAKSSLKYKATYSMTTGGTSLQMTQIFDTPKYAIESTTAGIQSKMIFDGSTMITCANQGSWSCFTISGTNTPSPLESQNSVETSIDTSGTSVTSLGACSEAGETGTSYKVVSGESTSTICYTSDGILLSMEATTNGQTVSMKATSVSRVVSASDFVPPATPQTINMGAGAYANYGK